MNYQVAFIFFVLASLTLAKPQIKVKPEVWRNLEENETTNILVTFKKANTMAAFARFNSLRLNDDRDAMLNAQYRILKEHADKVQGNVISMLNDLNAGKKHVVTQLWISAKLVVRYVDREVVEKLANHSDIDNINAELFISLEPTTEAEAIVTEDIQWGVKEIRAPDVWNAEIRGEGIIVAAIDTGCSYTHESLRTNYRGNNSGVIDHNYNWYDPSLFGSDKPSDSQGHGTHVTGTMCGTQNGIGVAPGAKWIACKGCSSSSCSTFDLEECGNWMACPTDLDNKNSQCSKAPHVVNNSWGGPGGDSWYDDIITAWRNVNIVPVFAAGNAGPSCSTMHSPGDRIGSIGVASTKSNDQISVFSSAGPTRDNQIKPDIAAPGESIISASYSSDTGYVTMSGTSMATPHIAGLVALILSKQPSMKVAQVADALKSGAVGITPANQTCGGISDSIRPNNRVGSGRVDAVNSLNITIIV